MVTVPKKVEYSLMLIADLMATDESQISMAQIGKKLNLPYRFLSRLAAELKTAGVLESREGKGGGYWLNSQWREKTLYDLMEVLGENKDMVRCNQCHRNDKCRMVKLWERLENNFAKELQKIKLTEI